jgi:hypothetical protein
VRGGAKAENAIGHLEFGARADQIPGKSIRENDFRAMIEHDNPEGEHIEQKLRGAGIAGGVAKARHALIGRAWGCG